MKTLLGKTVLAVSLLLSSAMVTATTSHELGLEDLVSKSETIVIGTVVDIHTPASSLEREVTVNVVDTLKGAARESVVIRMSGGSRTIGEFRVGEVVAGEPLLLLDDEVVLFLAESQSARLMQPVSPNQGIAKLQTTSTDASQGGLRKTVLLNHIPSMSLSSFRDTVSKTRAPVVKEELQ